MAHFRPDIEGLRGLAILLVVVFHAAPTLLGGGFIGVDVFFVISGFLITGLLVRELGRDGRIRLGNFYARRIRRLVPAAVLALGATFLLSAWLLTPLDLPRVAADGVSAALSVSNIRFALASGDYFTAVETPSPFLHYWSLSVEEQFYLVWPATLILAFVLGRGLRGVAVTVAALTVISLAAAILITDAAQSWAFYSLPTRAWQLAVGGLLAIVALERFDGRWRSAGLAALAWVGLAAVVLAGILLDDTIAYPGLWALLPTLGAVALIAGGDRPGSPGILLRTPPMRFLGRISYALYLWHWPLLVLPAIALGTELAPEQVVALVVLAVLVATASTILVEEPIRRGAVRASGRRQVAVAASLGLALLLSVSLGVGAMGWVTDEAMAASRGQVAALADASPPPEGGRTPNRRRDRDGPGKALVESGRQLDVEEGPATSLIEPPPDAESEPPDDPPAASDIPSSQPDDQGRSEGPTPTAKPKPRKAKPRTARPAERPVIAIPGDVKPSVWRASGDEEKLRDNGCLHSEPAIRPKSCQFGKPGGAFVVALVGDSHASHWFPALEKVAADRGWRLETFVKVSCPFIDIPVQSMQLKREYRECARFNDNVVKALRRLRPDIVITSLSRWQHPTRSADESATAQGAGMARILDRVPGHKVVIADVPYPKHDVPACLSKNLKDVRGCAVPSYYRDAGGSPARERIAARRSGGAVIDFGRVICGRGKGSCPVIRGGRIVYRDSHHLTATFSRWLAPAMDQALEELIRKWSR